MKSKIRPSSFLVGLACFSLTFGTNAQRIPNSVISTVVETSSVQVAAGQEQLYCGRKQGRVVGCWDQQKYDQWVASNVRLEDYSSESSNGLSDYRRQHLVVGDVPNTGSADLKQDITISESMVLHDPTTRQSLQYSFETPSGVDFRAAAQAMMAAVPGIIDFQNEQEAYRQVESAYQNLYSQAAQQNTALAQQIRSDASQVASQAHAQQQTIFPNLALSLASLPTETLSQTQLMALKSARQIAASALSHRSYQMNQSAYLDLRSKMKSALAKSDYDSFFAAVEPYARSHVDGHQATDTVFGGLINKEGVVNLNKLTRGRYTGPFDQRVWVTPLTGTDGEIVRRLANRFQQTYVDTNGLGVSTSKERAQFSLGELALAMGDNDLANGLHERGAAFLKLAEQLVVSVAGSTVGVGEGAVDLVKSIPELAGMVKDGMVLWTTEPKQTWAALVELSQSLPELSGLIKVAAIEKFDQLGEMSDYDRSRAIGHLVFDVVTTFATLGDSGAAEAVGQVGRLEAVASGATSAAVKTSVEEAADAMAVAARPIETSVEQMPKAARKGLEQYARNSPELAVEFAKVQSEMQAAGHTATAHYMDRMMGSSLTMSAEDISAVADAHAKLVDGLKTVSPAEFSGTVTRGVVKGMIPDGAGGMRIIKPADVLDLSPRNLTTEHRFSIGGDLGEKAQYFVVGDGEAARGTIRAELHVVDDSKIVYASMPVSSAKILDLTEQDATDLLRSAGISTKNIDSYIYTQAIGNAARANKYDGILYGSAKKVGGKNLVLFK